MNVIVVEDERIVLTTETLVIRRVLSESNVVPFQNATEALEYAEQNHVDIAFLDINMRGITGLELASKLQKLNPKINIIFCTGYSEYSLDAIELYCSAYLLKPITDEKVKTAIGKLRYPLSDKVSGLKIRCFGNFEAYYNGEPICFKNKKTKELLAYLIDRQGATVSTKEIQAVLFEDDNRESYIRNLRAELNNVFEKLGLSEIIVHDGVNVGINKEKIDCDYFDYLDGNKTLFKGEYMSQYSFAEKTLAFLVENKRGE